MARHVANGCPLSLVTVMIGSILVGVGVDFSIHIANRIRELGGGIPAIRSAAVGTGMSLFEAAVVTSLGMFTAYNIPIPEIQPFITVILILLLGCRCKCSHSLTGDFCHAGENGHRCGRGWKQHGEET